MESAASIVSTLQGRASIWIALLRLAYDWRRLRRTGGNCFPNEKNALRRVVIISCDPWTLVGSKGDEAMIRAVVEELQTTTSSTLDVGITTATEAADVAARSLGFAPLRIWKARWDLDSAIADIEAFKPDALLLLGADVMDGYYSPVTTARLLVMTDLIARKGIRAAILGFSFNAAPSKYLKPFFNLLVKNLTINVRDPISLARFTRFSKSRAALVADAAFMLSPGQTSGTVRCIAQWVDIQHAQNNSVLAFNIHPMLIKNSMPDQRVALINCAVEALKRVLNRHNLSVVLLSHDYRGNDSDDACLKPIYEDLRPIFGDKIFYPTDKMSASELKAVAGMMDGVVTGRMHLAIAALGMGVPVAALTYQDKFQGLFAHFNLPDTYLLRPKDVLCPAKLEAMIEQFLTNLPLLEKQVAFYLPQVRDASFQNLRGIWHKSSATEVVAV